MRHLILFLAAACAAFAQPASGVIAITASRQLNVQPDQVSLTVDVNTEPSQTLDNVLAALKGTGITANDLSNVSTAYYDLDSPLQWIFTPTVSFSALTTVAAALAALPANGPIALAYFNVNATASPQAVASQPCPYPALISDAQMQAAKVAAAAGVTVGPIVSLEQGTEQGSAEGTVIPLARVAAATWFVNYLVGPISSSAPACSLTVQFKLGQ